MSLIKRVKSPSLLAVLLAAMTTAPALAVEWIMASGYPDSNFMTKNIRLFIEDVEKASDGALTITLHPNDTLIKHDNIRRAVQRGQVQIGEIRLGVHSNEDPMYGLAALPFIASNYEEAWRLKEAQKPYFDQLMGEIGIDVLAYQPWPGQGFYTRFPVTSTEDFAGKKLRIYSRPTQEMGEALGFEATILPFAEIPQAFATGLIEALFTSPQTGIDIQAWDNTDYFTLVGAIYSKNAIIVNQQAFESLDPELQTVLLEAGERATQRGWEMSEATLKAQMETLADNGMTVTEGSAEIIEAMKAIGQTMMERWRESASPEAVAVLDNYLQSIQ
ncbi:MAG: TRAP transporter substrate-binding protein [Candidatus Competibacterales bacterium]